MMRIEARDLGRTSGGHRILRCVSLDFAGAGVFTIIGPNGAGKTTLLRALDLFDKPSAGEILYDGRAASGLSARDRTALRRRMGFVFQHPLLLNGTVIANMRYAFKARGRTGAEEAIANELAAVDLAAKRDLDVRLLSGGERQRLQLARAMVLEPEVLFADEPTANLDPLSARTIEDRLRRMAGGGRTVVLTTHNMLQARLFGDRAVFLKDGEIVQQGTALQVLERPATLDVAHFSPLTNVVRGRLVREGGTAVLEAGAARIQVVTDAPDGSVAAILRPEDIIVSREPVRSSARNRLAGKVAAVDDLGLVVILRVECGDLSLRVTITRQSLEELGIRLGEDVQLTFKASAVLVFAD
jgi:tungstate transport system ATP-binding protein